MSIPQEITPTELGLIQKMRANVVDLQVDKLHLTTKDLVRFIRARNHSLNNAEHMFRKYIEWRQKNDLDNVQDWSISTEYRITYWPWYVAGFDRCGNPVIIHPFGIWDANKVSCVGQEDITRYCTHSMESVWLLMQQRSQGQQEMKKFTIIFDAAGLSWRAVTTVDAVQATIKALQCFEANYPETLHVAFFVNAPYAFDILWRVVKSLLSENTRRKVCILPGSDSSSWKEKLSDVISPDNFWKRYGGNLTDYTEVPNRFR